MFSVTRIVALLTPVFTAGAALASAYAAKHGLNLPASEVLTVEIAAGTAGLGAALKWLHGYQAFEALEHDAEKILALIQSEEKVKGIPAAADSAHWNEQIQNLKEQLTEARAIASRATQAQAISDRKAGEALTQLAHVKAALDRVNAPVVGVVSFTPPQEQTLTPTVPAGAEQTQAS